MGAAFGGRAENKQHERQKEYMALQHQYNEQSADAAQARAMQMWKDTNYSAQRKELEKAGMNAALMYGGSGAGGGSTSDTGAQGQGVSQPTDQAASIGLQNKGMTLQLAQMASNIALNESQAKKNNAEANKIEGADTQLTEAETKFKQRITALQDELEKNLKAGTLESGARFHMIQSKERQVWAETRKALVDAEVGEKTKDEMIASAGLANWKTTEEALLTASKGKLNDQMIEKLKNDMAVAWANVALGEKSVSNEADKIANDLMIHMRDLDRKDQELLKDWIYEGVRAGKDISGEVLNWMTRGAGKNIKDVAGKIEEWFDGEGNVTQTKTTHSERTITE